MNTGRATAFYEINSLRLFGLPASGVHDVSEGGVASNGQGHCAHRRTFGGAASLTRSEGFDRLAKMGINIVVDTGRSKGDEKQIKQLGMRYVSLAWYCPFPKDDVFARFLKLIKENPDKKIFVHCRLGNDRTGMMIAAYRMDGQGWTAEQAMKEMHFFGYTAVHHLMCPGLAGYEKSFPERLKESPAFRELR